MPQGIQCWDEKGRIAVDLTDYNLRYMGGISVVFRRSESSKNVAFGGATQSGTIAIITTSSMNNPNEFSCRAYDGGFTIHYLPATNGWADTTLNIEVYNFE